MTISKGALFGAVALALTMPACQQVKPSESAAKVDTAAIADTIKAEEKKWSDSFQASPRSLDALVAPYATDAFFIAPGIGPTTGIAAITKAYEEGLKDPNFNISFAADKVDVAASGDLATSHGRFTETFTDPGTKQKTSVNGTFITVYRKQSDGVWKAVEDWAVADPA